MNLTTNEKRVLEAMDERPMRVIAAELGMTERNVKYYTDMLRAKFGVRQKWELVEKRKTYFQKETP